VNINVLNKSTDYSLFVVEYVCKHSSRPYGEAIWHLRCCNIYWVVLLFHLSWIYVTQITPISHPYHIHTTPISHLHHPHPSYITLHPHHIITFTSHPHHIHITSSYLHHLHHIYITSIIISSHVHHQYHTYITPTSHPHHIKITCTSLPYHTLHHIYTTPPQWHHHHAQSHLMRESHHIQKSSVAHLWTRDIIPFTLVANMDCQITKQGPTKIPQSVAKCSNTTSSKAPPPQHEHYLRYSPHWPSWNHDKPLYNRFFSQSDWGGHTSMRLLTTNGMGEKGMKGYTNPSKQDVLRYPSEFGRVFPTGRVYQYCQNF
jgi:hypothetical protein